MLRCFRDRARLRPRAHYATISGSRLVSTRGRHVDHQNESFTYVAPPSVANMSPPPRTQRVALSQNCSITRMNRPRALHRRPHDRHTSPETLVPPPGPHNDHKILPGIPKTSPGLSHDYPATPLGTQSAKALGLTGYEIHASH